MNEAKETTAKRFAWQALMEDREKVDMPMGA